jgi:hypothetical protein
LSGEAQVGAGGEGVVWVGSLVPKYMRSRKVRGIGQERENTGTEKDWEIWHFLPSSPVLFRTPVSLSFLIHQIGMTPSGSLVELGR